MACGLEEEAAVAVVGVGHVAVGTVVGTGKGHSPGPQHFSAEEGRFCLGVAAAAEFRRQMVAVFLAYYDVDAAAEGSDAPRHELGWGEEFDALHHADVDGHVEQMVSGLGVGEVDTVDEQNDLVEGAATHGKVALHIVAAACAQVSPRQHRYEVAKGVDGSVGEILRGEHRRRLGRAEEGVRLSDDVDGGQEAFVGVVVGLCRGLQGEEEHAEGGDGCGLVQLAVGNVGGQVADVHYPVQGVVGGIGRAAVATETERRGSGLFVLIHVCCKYVVLGRLQHGVKSVERDTHYITFTARGVAAKGYGIVPYNERRRKRLFLAYEAGGKVLELVDKVFLLLVGELHVLEGIGGGGDEVLDVVVVLGG